MNHEQIIEEAKHYIEGEDSMQATAKRLGISKRTLQLHLQHIIPETMKQRCSDSEN